MTDVVEGADIAGALLREYADLISIVPAAQIKISTLPEGASLPHILLSTVSSVERKPLKRGATVRTTDRIAVRVRASSLREVRVIRRLVVRCCAGRTGDIGGGSAVSITTDGAGPEGRGADNAFERTQDLRVSFDAVA